MDSGSRELVRRAAAYLVCVAFALTFLFSTLSGAQGHTALIRGVIVAAIAFAVSRILLKPLVDVVLSAMARDGAAGEDER
jgi:hypothetical protein